MHQLGKRALKKWGSARRVNLWNPGLNLFLTFASIKIGEPQVKIPCALDADPRSWFSDGDDREVVELLWRNLEGILLFVDKELAPEILSEIKRQGKFSAHLEELMRRRLVFTDRAKLAGLYRFERANETHGVLIADWRKNDLEIAKRKLFQAFDDIPVSGGNPTKFHLSIANSVHLIDGFLMATASRRPSVLKRLLVDTAGEIYLYCHFVAPESIENFLRVWPREATLNGQYSGYYSREEARSIVRGESDVPLKERAIRQFHALLNSEMSTPRDQKVVVQIFERERFPHDRQMEVIIPAHPSIPKMGTREDYFALGSGIESLTLENAAPSRVSQIYPSDALHMWSGFSDGMSRHSPLIATLELPANSTSWIRA